MIKPYRMFDTGFYKSDRIMPAHKCLLTIATMREIPDGTGANHFKLVKEENIKINGHEFRMNMMADLKKGLNREIEICYEKPTQFIKDYCYLCSIETRDETKYISHGFRK